MRRAAALALLGMTLNALWPLLANAEPHANFFSAEICSAGKAAGAVVSKLPLQLPASKHQVLHCEFCASGLCDATLDAAGGAFAAPQTATPAVVSVDGARHQRTYAFLIAESRAPPVFSRF